MSQINHLAVLLKILPYGTAAPNPTKILAGAGFGRISKKESVTMPDLPEPKTGTSVVTMNTNNTEWRQIVDKQLVCDKTLCQNTASKV